MSKLRIVALWECFFSLGLGTIGCAPTSLLITPVSSDQTLREYTVLRESAFASKKIALVEIEGLIVDGRPRSLIGVAGENPVSLLAEKLERAAKDSGVKAVVLRIDSPGGGVTASDLMYDELRRFREKTGKPIVACMLDVAASGGYYVACAADQIYAQPTTVTGSIGVIMMMPDLSGTMDKLGIGLNVIKSGKFKDAGSPFREMKPDEQQVFQHMIDEMYARFLTIVMGSRRGIDEAKLRELADGRVMLGADAQKAGLVDEVGSIYAAIAAAKKLAGISERKVQVVQYARPLAHQPNVYAQSPVGPAGSTTVNLINLNLPELLTGTGPRFMYLWMPGQ